MNGSFFVLNGKKVLNKFSTKYFHFREWSDAYQVAKGNERPHPLIRRITIVVGIVAD